MKLIIYLTIILGLTGALSAQYEEGSFGTTGDRTVENTVKDGTLIIVGKFYDNTEGGYAGGGGSYFHARVEVSQILYGTCKSTLPASYKVLPRSAKQPDGTYRQIPGRHAPPAEGTELIAIGKWYNADVEKGTKEQFSVLRYLYVTPENLKHVGGLIREYKAKELAASHSATTMLDQGLTAALEEAAGHVKPPQVPVKPREVPSKVQQTLDVPSSSLWMALTGLGIALLAAAVFFWRKQRA